MAQAKGGPSDGGGELLERWHELSELESRLEAIGSNGPGHVTVVTGEAGIGKTSLLSGFQAAQSCGPRFLCGASDPLFTPRPLGSIWDVAEQLGGETRRLIEADSKPFELGASL